MTLRRPALLLLLALPLLWQPPGAAQLPGEPVAASGIVEEDLGEDVAALLAEAEVVFRSNDQPESIPLYERIILLLERWREEGRLDAQGGDWLELALFRRAEARSNLLDNEGAAADLGALLRLDPGWEIPAGYSVSRPLSKLLDEVRDAETGILDPLIEPADAEIYLDGEPLGPLTGPRRVLAGERLLAVRRPGFEGIEQPLTVPPGGAVPIALTLERTSAVVRLTTQPAGVEVVQDGVVLGVSRPPEGGPEEGLSEELAVAGLEPGERLLTLRKPGYRPLDVRLEIGALADYALRPVTLEPSRGTLVVSGLPAQARLLLDGAPLPGPPAGAGELRLELPPGAHRLRVEAGPAGLFERRFELADRQRLELEVTLRPALVLLGVLGGDRVAASSLESRLAERLGALAGWALDDESERGFELLRGAAIDRQLLRGLAAGTGAVAPPDWAALQRTLDRGLSGSAYLLAVLSDDLYASRADLWLWSAAPGPTRPAQRRIGLADGAGIEELATALDRPLRLATAWIGARFVDSPAAADPLVLAVEPGGPAAAAGLRPGETVGELDGRPVASARELGERLAGILPGSELALGVDGAGGARRLTLTAGESPRIAALGDPSALDPALAARLTSLEASPAATVPGWVVRLNRGVILMRSGEWRLAAEALRGIEAPARAGVGQATVDYLLGITLLEVDAATYRETARGLIGRAAEGGARLEHDDGPPLAPRARARLERLQAE